MDYKQIEKCRICGNIDLVEVLDLGEQSLTGVFPKTKSEEITAGPLKLVKCHGEGDDICHLVQLQHTYNLDEMYGDNYGYRSGLNASMVRHLKSKVDEILRIVDVKEGDIVIDIGSNDGTTLGHYPENGARLIGIDPTGKKFASYYKDHVELVPDFFSAEKARTIIGDKKAKVVTSFSMFYDLEDPAGFAQDVADILDIDGIWVLEQSYMPEMVKQTSYDTVCHEHLEYYGLRQIQWIADKVGLKLLDVAFNDTNGGSFSVICAPKESSLVPEKNKLDHVLKNEVESGFGELAVYNRFAEDVAQARQNLLTTLQDIKDNGKTVYGLGASTKGNVILQYCGITEDLLPAIGEVNDDKFGCYTPGTELPIIAETDVLASQPDYLLILPWHFKKFFEANDKFKELELIYPLSAQG